MLIAAIFINSQNWKHSDVLNGAKLNKLCYIHTMKYIFDRQRNKLLIYIYNNLEESPENYIE